MTTNGLEGVPKIDGSISYVEDSGAKTRRTARNTSYRSIISIVAALVHKRIAYGRRHLKQLAAQSSMAGNEKH